MLTFLPSLPVRRALAQSSGRTLRPELAAFLRAYFPELGIAPPSPSETPVTVPLSADIYEDDKAVHIRAEIPGVAREDVSVEVVEGQLVLTANRKAQGNGLYEAITLKQSFEVPEEFEIEKASAQCEHGVLTVTLPRKAPAPAKKIAIDVK